VARPATIHPNNPVARPVYTQTTRPVYTARPVYQQSQGYGYTRPVYQHYASRPVYHSPVVAFGAGAALGAGGVYLATRYNNPYRYYHRPSYYHTYYGFPQTHVVHHHHYDSDGPYFRRQWQSTSPYDTVRFDAQRPPVLPRPRQHQTNHAKQPTSTSILVLEVAKNLTKRGLVMHIRPSLYYRSDEKKDDLRSMDPADMIPKMPRIDLGPFDRQLEEGKFQSIESGLDTYVKLLESKTTLVGIAIYASIEALSKYKGSVADAQTALDKLEWKTKPKNIQFYARILSPEEQVRNELLSAATFGYQGVAAMDDLSSPRIGDAVVGERSFGVKYMEQVATCTSNGLAKAADELTKVQKVFTLPEVSKESKWNPDADCDGQKASERLRHMRAAIEKEKSKSGEPVPSTEELQKIVMQEPLFEKAFRTGTEKVLLRGAWVATGIFCHGAGLAQVGFCDRRLPRVPCEDLQAACAKDPNSEDCQEHRDRCDFVNPSRALQKIDKEYTKLTSSKIDADAGKCTDVFDLMYTKVALEKWFHADARLAFTENLGSLKVEAGAGIALFMLETFDKMPKPNSDSLRVRMLDASNVRTTTAAPEDRGALSMMGVVVVFMIAPCCLIACCILACCCFRRKTSTATRYPSDAIYSTYQDNYQEAYIQQQHAPAYMDFQCPMGSFPGELVQVTLPDGSPLQVTIPDGVYGGMNFSVEV